MAILCGMATQPIDTAKVYALTAAGACSVTLMQGDKSITWEALSEGGQTSFIIPAGASAEVSDSSALLSPLPVNFNTALGARAVSAGGERISTAPLDGNTAAISMRHTSWWKLPENTKTVMLHPGGSTDTILTTQLMVSPATDMQLEGGWLKATGGAHIIWLYRGEPDMSSAAFTYIITLVQLSPTQILANLSAILPRF